MGEEGAVKWVVHCGGVPILEREEGGGRSVHWIAQMGAPLQGESMRERVCATVRKCVQACASVCKRVQASYQCKALEKTKKVSHLTVPKQPQRPACTHTCGWVPW